MNNLFRTGFGRLMGTASRAGAGSAARSPARIAGDASRDIRDWAGAIDAYRRHLETFPGDFAIQVQLGHALKEVRDFGASMEAYHAAYRLDSRDSDLLVNIGHLHKMRGQQAAACFAYVAGYALDANVDAATELGDPQLAADIEAARDAFSTDPTRDPVVLAVDVQVSDAALMPDHIVGHGDAIETSPLFDAHWYRQRYGVGADLDAARHYTTVGAAEGHEPHRLFDSRFYRSQVTGDLPTGANPLDHFLKIGGPNGLDPHPLFAGDWYREHHPAAARTGVIPIIHYLTHAPHESAGPTPLFDALRYREATPDMAAADATFAHYLDYGDAAGVAPIAGLQTGRILETFGGSPVGGESALELYVHFLGRKQALACATFDLLAPSDVGVRPPPLPLASIRPADERIAAASEVVQRLLGDTATGEGRPSPDRYALAKLDLLRRDPDQFDAVVRDLHAATAATASEVVTMFGVLPLHDVARGVGDAGGDASGDDGSDGFPAGGVLDRYRTGQRDLARRFRLDHDRVGTVTDGVTISILLPIYRSPVVYLERAILSVLAQTYANWELCIVDDCSREPALTDIVTRFCAADARIKFATSRRNGGIAEATNRALDLATGAYVALFDHDDMLTVDALEIVAARIDASPDTDWLYSDECKIGIDDQPDELLTKPDWSPALLLSVMYTGHLSVYRSTLVRSVGGFCSAYDFSQDYDLALRISETAPTVQHIRDVLYGWRMIEGSAASGGKPEARLTNIAAVQAAMDRRGWTGRAVALPASNRPRADYATFDQLVSIIIPSDDAGHIVRTVMSIVAWTAYPRYEIVIVTNSRTAAQCREWMDGPRIRFAIFDAPYNFSAKCNAGAALAQGDYVVFHNDDVLVITPDWIEALLEQLVRPGVGGVSPKLLYENGRIQYAGMAVGLRQLTGTTFHAFPRDTAAHFNLAQSTRDVGLLCGACLAMPTELFRDLGGWDALNVGIAHSDVDLSLRLREAGYRLVYTPHAELIHIGHASIGASIGVDADLPTGARWKKSKAEIFLLKRFPSLIADDPYFPPTMSGISYIDSQEPYRIHPATLRYAGDGPDILIVSHDLTNSGAPRVAADMAIALKRSGAFVVVTCPTDGPMRARLAEADIPVIIDALALTDHASFRDFARNFDTVIVNTVIGWRVVKQLDSETEVRWYIHESGLIDEMVRDTDGFRAVLGSARNILAVSTRTAAALRRHGVSSRLLETGISDPKDLYPVPARSDVVRIGVFGSFEPRKGQDIAAQAFAMLPPGTRANATLDFFGRDHDPDFQEKVRRTWQRQDGIHFHGEKGHPDYWYCLADIDIVLVPSRDDPLPLVASDALALGKTIVCSDSTGTADYIEHEVSGFVYPTARAADLSALLARLIEDRTLRESVRAPARAVYEAMFTMEAFTERLSDRLAPVAVGVS